MLILAALGNCTYSLSKVFSPNGESESHLKHIKTFAFECGIDFYWNLKTISYYQLFFLPRFIKLEAICHSDCGTRRTSFVTW